jgi:hypothetical protein
MNPAYLPPHWKQVKHSLKDSFTPVAGITVSSLDQQLELDTHIE